MLITLSPKLKFDKFRKLDDKEISLAEIKFNEHVINSHVRTSQNQMNLCQNDRSRQFDTHDVFGYLGTELADQPIIVLTDPSIDYVQSVDLVDLFDVFVLLHTENIPPWFN